MRIYISGPITNTPDYKENFERGAKWILSEGHEPVNPVEVDPECGGVCAPDGQSGYDGKPHTWECYLRYDLILMLSCEIVYALAGWKNSKGATLEIETAKAIGMPIVYQT